MVMVPVNDLPYYSWDMGKTWTKATFPNGTEPTFIDKIWKWNNVLQSDRVESDTFYLINPNNGKFYISTNGGKTWSLRWERGSGKAAVRIKTAPGLKNTVFMSLANEGLMKSTNGGKTFEKVTNVDHAGMIAFGKGIDDSVPALYLYGKTANEDGIFRSVDLGETWEKISNAQTAVGGDPNCMEGDRQTFGTVYIGTNGRGFYVGEEKKEEVIHVWYDDAGCTSGDHTGAEATGGYFILQAGTTNMNQTDVVYNGTKAIEVTGSTTYVKYNGYNADLANIATATEAIKTGNSYICGWFYTTGDNSHIKLVNTDQKIEKKNEWVFMYERIPANTTSVNAFFAERSTKAKLYVDDLKLVKVSDGSVPTPFKRDITNPSQPDMYTKTLHTFYSDGELNAFQQHPNATYYLDYADTEKTVDVDSKSIKMTGELYLQFTKDGKVVTYGELSDEVRGVFVNVNMGRLGAGFEGFAPRENVHFKRPGGTNNYVHGGMSLQELCVPVIGFWRARSGSKDFVDTRAATLRVLSEGRRVTNSLFSVNLIQEEPAQGKVLPCEYELVFTDASGNEVSDTVKAHANKTSANSQERVVHAKFALHAADGFSAKGPYYLVCRERETGKIVWRETYTIAVSFAPVADFGF